MCVSTPLHTHTSPYVSMRTCVCVCVCLYTHTKREWGRKRRICSSAYHPHRHTHTHIHTFSLGTIAFDFHRGAHTRKIDQKMSKTITFERARRTAWEREEEVLEEATAQEKRRAATA